MATSSVSSREAVSSFQLRTLVALALAALAVAAPADASSLSQVLEEPIRGASRVAREIGVHVVDVVTGETVVAVEPDRPRIAASNTKLFTTAAALDALGPEYLFETHVMVRGYRVGRSLLGDLGVVAGGDPNISGRHHGGDPLAVFRKWASAIKAQQVDAISGDLYLANGLFDDQRVHPDWPRDQLHRWYEAPVDALSFSDNCVLVRVLPGAAPGRPAKVELVPDVSILTVRNIAGTTSSARRHAVNVFRAPDSDEILVSGDVYRNAEPVEAWVTVPDPQRYFGAALRKALADEGVALDGEVVPVGNLPAGRWRPLTVHRSDLLSTIEVINHRSQNFYAESLLKLLGAEICTDGSWQSGREVVADFLEGVGIPASSYRMEDGSGMSRNNLFTPRQLTRLLVHMYHHPLSAEFIESLPPSGSDNGRWDERLAQPPYAGNVRAKTGTLRAVSALSGYARGLSGKMYAFSILQNRASSAWDARRTQDRIIRALIDHG